MFKIITPIFLLSLVNTLGFSILIPILPFVVRNLNASDFVYGLLISAYSFFQFLAAPILGKLSDNYGRKPLLVISQAGTLFSWFIFGAAWFLEQGLFPSVIVLITISLARVFDGITGGNNSITNTYLTDVIPPEKRSVAFSYLGAGLGLGIIIGPALGAFFSKGSLGYLGTALFSIGLNTVALLCIIFFLKESKQKSQTKLEKINFLQEFNWIKNFRKVIKNKILRQLFVLKMFVAIVMTAYTSVIVLLLIDVFDMTATEVGNILLIVGAFLIFNQFFLVKIFIQKIGEQKSLLLGLILMALGLFTFPVNENLLLFVLFYYFTNLGLSLSLPTLKSLISNNAEEKSLGEILGFEESLNSLFMAFVPLISAFAYTFLKEKSFWLWAGISLLGAVYFLTCKAKSKIVKTA